MTKSQDSWSLWSHNKTSNQLQQAQSSALHLTLSKLINKCRWSNHQLKKHSQLQLNYNPLCLLLSNQLSQLVSGSWVEYSEDNWTSCWEVHWKEYGEVSSWEANCANSGEVSSAQSQEYNWAIHSSDNSWIFILMFNNHLPHPPLLHTHSISKIQEASRTSSHRSYTISYEGSTKYKAALGLDLTLYFNPRLIRVVPPQPTEMTSSDYGSHDLVVLNS